MHQCTKRMLNHASRKVVRIGVVSDRVRVGLPSNLEERIPFNIYRAGLSATGTFHIPAKVSALSSSLPNSTWQRL